MVLSRIPLAIATNKGRSTPVTDERIVNLYPILNPPGSKTPYTLLGSPGLLPWYTVGSGPIRGVHAMGLFLYVVSAEELYRVDATGTATLLGSVTGTAPVWMTDNGYQVVIVGDYLTYVATETTLTNVSAVDATSVAVQDGYAIYGLRGTDEFQLSDILDATSIDASQFASVSSLPGDLMAVATSNRELWLFKERVIETWYNSGDAFFPFTRNASGVINRGCMAAKSVVVIGGVPYWLGDDGRVYRAAGYIPQPISTHAVEYALGTYTRAIKQAANAWTYTQEGHVFYVLSCQSGTWVFDLTTDLWHERQSFGQTRWRASCFAEAFGKLLVGDVSTSDIFELDLAAYDEDGATLQRTIQSNPVGQAGQRFVMHSYQLDAEVGVGSTTVSPQAMLDWSDDGGRTWSNEHWRGLGLEGTYKTRTIWRRLGMFRERTMRITITAAAKVAIYGALAEIEPVA